MYLAIPPQSDCITAWREAVRLVDQQERHEAYNVIIDVGNPLVNTDQNHPCIKVVNDFLLSHDKSVETVANTIFPQALYHTFGAPQFFDIFRNQVLKKVRRNDRWSGYYFERMIQFPYPADQPTNQLWSIVERLRSVTALNKFEMSLFDPVRDVDESPYGGQCLSFLSFKVHPGEKKTLTLTAMYRNHYYIEKLLGNLIGLGRLMAFVAREAGLDVGTLTVVSTHAVIDCPGKSEHKTTRAQLKSMWAAYDQAAAMLLA